MENYNRTFVCFLFPFLRSTLLRFIPKMSSTAVISFFGIVLVFGSLKCNANKTDLYILQMVASFDKIPCKGMTLAYDVAKNSSSFKSFFEKYEIKMNCSLTLVSSQLALWGRVSSFLFDKGRSHFYDILVREIEHRLYDKREVFVMSRIIKVEVGVIRGRPFNSWGGEGGGGGDFWSSGIFFFSNLVGRIFFSPYSHKLFITFALHAIFFFRQALAGNFFSKITAPPRPHTSSRVKWSAP